MIRYAMYAAKISRYDVASILPMRLFLPVQALTRSMTELNVITPRSAVFMLAKDNGHARAEAPRIRRIFEILDPRIFPKARAPFFFAAATTQVTSSGIDVPPARIVIATNLSESPAARAMRQAASTK